MPSLDHSWYEPITEWGIFVLTMIGGLITWAFNSTLKGLQKEMKIIKETLHTEMSANRDDLQRQVNSKASKDTVEGLDKRLAEIAENVRETRRGVDNLASRLFTQP